MNTTIKVSIPSDEGFIGRECEDPDCVKYFKVHESSLKDEMYCPYCAKKYTKEALLTSDQSNHIRNVVEEEAKELAINELHKMFRNLSRKHKNLEFKGKDYKAKKVSPKYSERKIDSEITCFECDTQFQVYGIFGFCPGCKSENLQIYDANFEIIKRDLNSNEYSQRSLRHAYSDLVSTFEITSEKQAARITKEKANFQDLFETRRFFKKNLGLDILSKLDSDEELTLRRIFQKRHIYIHNEGKIGPKYVKKIPEDTKIEGEKAELKLEEFEVGVSALKKVFPDLIKAVT